MLDEEIKSQKEFSKAPAQVPQPQPADDFDFTNSRASAKQPAFGKKSDVEGLEERSSLNSEEDHVSS